MQLDTVHDPRAAEAPPQAAATWSVDRPAGEAPLRVFRRTLILRFPDPGAADRIVVGSRAPVLRGRFLAFDYDALSPAEPGLRAATENGEDATVVAALDGPRRVLGADFDGDLAVRSGDRIDLFRLDGDVLAPEPSHTLIGSASTVASLAALPAAGQAGDTFQAAERVAAPGLGAIVATPAIFQPPTGFTDQRLALRLRRNRAPVALRASDLARLTVRGLPTAPRLGLAPVERLDEAVFFWRVDGQPGGDRPSADGAFDAGPELAEALAIALDDALEERRALGHSGPLDIALVVESDAPCRFRLDALAIEHAFEIASFEDGEPKRSLRFSGQAVETRTVPIALPGGAEIQQASARVKESLGDPTIDGGVPTAAPTARNGRLLEGDTRVTLPIQLVNATEIEGIVLALVPLRPATEVAAQVVEDHRGEAAGRVLAELTVSLDAAGALGRSVWAVARLDEPLILSTAPHWLVVRATAGAAVWLEDDGAPPADGQPFVGGHRLLSAARTDRPMSPLAAAIAGRDVPAGALAEDGSRTLDLTDALRAATLEQPGVTPDLALTAGSAGLITVYPPTVRYVSQEA